MSKLRGFVFVCFLLALLYQPNVEGVSQILLNISFNLVRRLLNVPGSTQQLPGKIFRRLIIKLKFI